MKHLSSLLFFCLFVPSVSTAFQNVDITFRLHDPNKQYLRVFVPGSFNNWGPNVDGAIAEGAPSEMSYNPNIGYWEKEVALPVGTKYSYKFHYHTNAAGSAFEWIQDPRNPNSDGDPFYNSLGTATNPMAFPWKVDSTAQGELRLMGDFHASSALTNVHLVVEGQSYNIYGSVNPEPQILHFVDTEKALCPPGSWYKLVATFFDGETWEYEGYFGTLSSDTWVPDWAQDAIWYQIFPERFRNGDSNNDPDRESLEAPGFNLTNQNWTLSDWTKDWYHRQDWEVENGHHFYENGVFDRRFGGDLQGVLDQLDYLEDLGVNAIYFNPIYYAPSLHKYDVSYHHHIDPHFGPNPTGDKSLIAQENEHPNSWHWTQGDSLFLKILAEAHARDMRVIIDGVFNHSGRGALAFQHVLEHQANSAYADWYDVISFDDPNTAANEFEYNSFFGFEYLPAYANDASGNNLVQPVKDYLFAVTHRWMDPNGDGDPSDGVDGWRLDAAALVPDGFWREWNRYVRGINPEAYTVLEEFAEASDQIRDGYFSAAMNYQAFLFPMQGFFIIGESDAAGFVNRIQQIDGLLDPANQPVMQNLMDSHDTERIASMLVNNSRDGITNNPWKDEKYEVSGPNEVTWERQKLLSLFQFVWRGAPMIYYGTESGMWGAQDPDCRKPMNWPDLLLAPETQHPFGQNRESSDPNFNARVYHHYKQLIQLRNHYTALRRGTVQFLSTHENALVLAREHEGVDVISAINNANKTHTVSFTREHEDLQGVYQLSANPNYSVSYQNGQYRITLPPYGGLVLSNETNFSINFPPFVPNVALEVKGTEDEELELDVTDIPIFDQDSLIQLANYTVQLLPGNQYEVVGQKIRPEPNFNGELTVRLQVSDGQDFSPIAEVIIPFQSVNDAPTDALYFGDSLRVFAGDTLVVSLDDFQVSDVDHQFPEEFQLVWQPGSHYTVVDNSVIINQGFEGHLSAHVRLSDGVDASEVVAVPVKVASRIVQGLSRLSSADLHLYPNPATETVHWAWKGDVSWQNIAITSTFGQVVWQQAIQPHEGKGAISVSHLPKGWYIITAWGEAGWVSRRFWKE